MKKKALEKKDVVGFKKGGDVDKSLKTAKKNAQKNTVQDNDEEDSDEEDESDEPAPKNAMV